MIKGQFIKITPQTSLELLSPKETVTLKTVDSEVCSLYYYIAIEFSNAVTSIQLHCTEEAEEI